MILKLLWKIKISSMINLLKEALFSFFFSPICPCCKELNDSHYYFCSSCLGFVELSTNKRVSKEGRYMEVFCFENKEPMRSFYQSLLLDKHPKKIETALSFILLQMESHKIVVESLGCFSKRNSAIYKLSKQLSERLKLPLKRSKAACQYKKILIIDNPNERVQIERAKQIVYLSFLSS